MNFFEIHKYPSRKNFPVYGNINRLYIDLESNKFYYWQDGKYFKISTTELDQATYDDLNRTLGDTYETIVNSDNKLALKANKTYVDTKVDRPEGSPNNYFSESNEYLPLQRFARVRYQSSTGWAKVAEVTLPASADERKSAIFFVNSENNSSTTSESWFGILEWNIHENPASNSIKWLVTYGFGENNFNIRHHSDTNTLSFFVLPTVGNMNLWLASESTNGHVTSDIVLFDAASNTTRTGVSVASKADYLSHAGHVRDTRKVANIALSGDISVEALIDVLKASDSSDTDKLTTVELVADMFAELVNGAPAALDTLQELAQALDDDPNFATTITNLIGTKLSKVDAQNTYETIVNSDNKLLLKADKTYVDDVAASFNDTNTIPLVEVTWQELKDKRDDGELIPGQQYRITDYVTTTAQADTQSAGHRFDIIVTADDVDKLNENARAVRHEVAANGELLSWFEHSASDYPERFFYKDSVVIEGLTLYRWASYEELNNDHNSQYLLTETREVGIGDVVWGYQIIDDGETHEVPVYGEEEEHETRTIINVGEGYMPGYDYFYNSKLEAWQLKYCLDNDANRFTWADEVNGKGVIYRMIDEFNNDVPYDFKNIQFKKADVWYNTFDGDITGSSYSNKIGVYTSSGATLNAITFGSQCYSNTFGDGCFNSTFGNACHSNTFGNRCYYNTFGNNCYYNTFGNGCSDNTFGSQCYSNTFGVDCCYNTFGNDCYNNSFNNGCSYNTFGNRCYYNTFGVICRYLQLSDGSSVAKKYIHVENGTQGASSANKFNLYDFAVLNKNYQVTFSKDAVGNYIMKWHNTLLTYTGKYKTSNTDNVWKDITPVETYE